MKGQNGQFPLFWGNGSTDLEDLGSRLNIWMSYALSMDWILHIAPGVPAPAHRKMKFDSSINCQKGASYVQKYASYNLELSFGTQQRIDPLPTG